MMGFLDVQVHIFFFDFFPALLLPVESYMENIDMSEQTSSLCQALYGNSPKAS